MFTETSYAHILQYYLAVNIVNTMFTHIIINEPQKHNVE